MSNEVKRIIGNTVGIPSPHTDFNQTDPTKGDYLKNRDELLNLIGKKLDKTVFDKFVANGGGSGSGGGNTTSGIIDLGTFQLIYDEDYNEVVNTTAELGKAIDNARETGIYSVRYEEGQVQKNEYGQEVSRNIYLSETELIMVVADISGTHEVVTQFCLTQDNVDNGNNDYIVPLKMRKYYYDLEKKKHIWTQYQELENAQYKVDDINTPNIDPMQCYPSIEAVSNFVNGKIVTDYDEWFEKTDGEDFNTKIPSIGVVSNFFEYSSYLSANDIVDTIPPDAEGVVYTNIPNVNSLVNYVDSQMNKPPQTELPAVLKVNTEYNFGTINNALILFPEQANDGDVIYVVFTAGTLTDNVLIAINIDFTSGLTDFEPEPGKKYEIYGRYDARDAIWLCGYSEY